MNQNPRDNQIRRARRTYFPFNRRRGLYLPRGLTEDVPGTSEQTEGKPQGSDTLLKWLTFLVLVVQATIAYQQWGTARTTQRAWVVPEIDVVGLHIDKPAVGVTVALVNHGGSPAFNAMSVSDWSFSPFDLPGPERLGSGGSSLLIPPKKTPPQAISIVLGARPAPGKFMGVAPDLLTERDRDDIQQWRKRVYVGGVIRYDDPYGTGRETRWCMWYMPVSGDFVPCAPGEGVSYVR